MSEKMIKELTDALNNLLKTNLLSDPFSDKVKTDIENAYKKYGFDVNNPPTEDQLAGWACELLDLYGTETPEDMNLPLISLIFAFEKIIGRRFDSLELLHMKVLSSIIYNMGYKMAKLNIVNPFEKGKDN
jgi:hypothetical protein